LNKKELEMVESDFQKGLNITDWLQYTKSAEGIKQDLYRLEDFEEIKKIGVSIIRMPIRFSDYITAAPDFTLSPLLYQALDHAVEYAEKCRMYLIIDNHSSDGSSGKTDESIEPYLNALWTQLAARYADRSNYIVYEIMNEPYGTTAEMWGPIQGRVLDVIRKYDTKHSVIVGGHSWNSIDTLYGIPEYKDDNLIYTFHFYDPHIFTHQGATWGGPPTLADLKDLCFPAGIRPVPECPASLKGSSYEKNLNDYDRLGDPAFLEAAIDKAVAFGKERGVPLFCGEYGVFMKNSRHEDRVRWDNIVCKMLDDRKISRTNWGFKDSFGFLKQMNGGKFPDDLDPEIIEASGFHMP
jgi:endoglucanase